MEREDFTPPSRQSLSDDELDQLVKQSHSDSAGTLAAMEALAQQAQLRQQDDLAFAQWVTKLESIGTPEALHAIENAKRALAGQAPAEFTAPPIEAAIEATDPSDAALAEEFRPVSTLPVAAVEVGEPLEHDLAPVAANVEPEEIVDVELDLHTGVAVSDFDAILHSDASAENDAFEPDDFETSQVAQVGPKKHGRSPASLFWVWLSLTAGLVPAALGFAMKSVGVVGLQAFVALAIGVLASAVVVGVGAVAGKRSGMATSIISRSTFGVYGNLIPGILNTAAKLVLTALFGLGVLNSFNGQLFGFDLTAAVTPSISNDVFSSGTLVFFGLIAIGAVLAALRGRAALATQIVIGALGFLAVMLLVGRTPNSVSQLFVNSNGSWWNTLGVALLIFAGLGGLWGSSAADFTTGLATSASGFKVFAFATLGFIMPLVSGSLGVIIAANSDGKQNWFGTLGLSGWQATTAEGMLLVSVIGCLTLAIASIANALGSLGLRLSRVWLLVLGASFSAAVALSQPLANAWNALFELLPAIGVPLLAWAGLFTSEVLIRRMAYHEVSLQHGYGIYRSINWLSVSGFIVAVMVGLGYVQSGHPWFSWTGYLIKLSGGAAFWNESQLGLGIAFLIGAITPVAFGIGRIKRQEAEMQAIENRRLDLNNVDLNLD